MKTLRNAFVNVLSPLMVFLLMVGSALAQRPTHIPPESPPVSFFDSASNIIIYIVIPIIIIVMVIVWRSYTRKEKLKKEEKLRKMKEGK